MSNVNLFMLAYLCTPRRDLPPCRRALGSQHVLVGIGENTQPRRHQLQNVWDPQTRGKLDLEDTVEFIYGIR